MFPKDTAGKLTFLTAPVTDPDADDTPTVEFTFKFDDADATEIAKKPDAMLLAVHFDETNHTYEFTKSSAYTIEKYRDVYNTTGAQTTLDGTMTADDDTDTAELSFTLTVQHDASAQFQTPATHQSNNRWQVSTTYEVYEGPGAADAISLAWQASTPDAKRSWYAGIDSESPIKCYDGSSSTATTVSDDWPESADDLPFSVSNTTDDTATIPSEHFPSPSRPTRTSEIPKTTARTTFTRYASSTTTKPPSRTPIRTNSAAAAPRWTSA